jgi:hypothetical protein
MLTDFSEVLAALIMEAVSTSETLVQYLPDYTAHHPSSHHNTRRCGNLKSHLLAHMLPRRLLISQDLGSADVWSAGLVPVRIDPRVFVS